MSDRYVTLLSDWGVGNASDCVEAQGRLHKPYLSDCVALLENESGGRNIFGADPGGSALPRRWFDTAVTHAKYDYYRARRNAGMTPNGVGPCQLTDAGLQKAADRAGGCWKPLYNMLVGFAYLAQLQERYGGYAGFAAYNGSGPAAIAYADRATERAATWHERFVKAGLA